MRKKITLLIILALAMFFVGCAKRSDTDAVFRFEAHELTITVGEQINITLIRGNVSEKAKIEYVNENPEIISFSNGTLVGLQKGVAKIIAKVVGDESTTATILINVENEKLSSLKINGKNGLFINETASYNAEVSPSYADGSVTWKSSNVKIATIDSLGKLTAISAGTVTVSAISKYDSSLVAMKSVEVWYHNPTDVEISFESGSDSLIIGTTAKVNAKVSPELANPNVTWSSSDTKVATIDTLGNITTLSVGTTDIKATTMDGTLVESLTLTVKYDDPTKIEITDLEDNKIYVDEELQLKTTLEPEQSNPEITWSSSDEEVATVVNGKVTGVKAGTVTITAQSSKEGVLDTVEIIVEALPEPQSVVVKFDGEEVVEAKLEIMEEVDGKFEVSFLPEEASQGFKYEIANEDILSVQVIGRTYKLVGGIQGVTTITVSSEEYPDVKVVITVTVIPFE